jgi:hypothetical protein
MYSVPRVFQEPFMKRVLPAFIVMSIMLAAARPAAADVKTGYRCHTPGVVDGGYAVLIETDGAARTARVFVSAESIAGPRPLGSYAVRVTQSGPVTVFEGGGLSLTMREQEWQRVSDASFIAVTDHSVVKGDLGCSPL